MFRRDLFICHAHRDRDEYARPLVGALGRHALSCWIDEGQVGPGDSLVESINAGLAQASAVCVLVTPRFFDGRWAKEELEAAFAGDVAGTGGKVIPVLAIPEEEWFRRFPLAAARVYVPWRESEDGVAATIAAAFPRSSSTLWHCLHPREHVGHVWIRVNADGEGRGLPHRLRALWGPYTRQVEIAAPAPDPVSLVHHKMQADEIVLHVQVEPAAIVTFGQGPAPDPPDRQLNIDEGWTRTAGWTFPTAPQG